MNLMTDEKYQVLVTRVPVAEPNGHQQQWRATVLGWSGIVEEAVTREQVIRQIEARIAEILRHSEIVTLTAPAVSPAATAEDELLAMGWDDHRLFKDDPEALKLFDEIEEERDRHRVGCE